MHKLTLDDVARVCPLFAFHGEVVSIQPFGNGHINDTFRIRVKCENGALIDYILQRINTVVFKDPIAVMNNIRAVTEHVARHIRVRGGNALRQTLTVVPTVDNQSCAFDERGGCWRADLMITDSVSHDTPDSLEMFESAARTFGEFFMDLDDFPAEKLAETIPMFHNTPNRLRQLEEAIENNAAGRLGEVTKEIEDVLAFAKETSYLVSRLDDGRLPLRVTHNDTKLNNILFDRKTDEGLCVIDLDTVMPGLVAYDFGDAIRFAANFVDEDSKDYEHAGVNMEMYRAFAKGFLKRTARVLTENEVATLALGCFAITVEQVTRFLDDYIMGSTYFKINYPEHNLVRTRCQAALAKDMEKKLPDMEEIVRHYVDKYQNK